jgi:Tfp pilus assembly protein PilN
VSQVNLLPPELRQRQVVRRNTTVVAVAGVGLLAVIGAFYFLQVMNLNRAKDDLAAQQAVNSGLTSDIAGLQDFANLQTELESKEQLVDTVYANEVAWSVVLLDVSRAIPSDAYLTSLSAQISAVTGEAPPTAVPGEPTNLIGSISFEGQALEADTIATWLTHLDQVKGWVNAWLQSANETGPFTKIYDFSSGVDVTTDAVTKRGKAGLP